MNLKPWWRLSISVNDDPEAMLVLPPLDENIKDKIMLLQAQRFEMPMPSTTADERREFWNALKAEVPMLINSLLETDTPKSLLCRRYGVTTWHNPELVEDLDELSAEAHLLNLIDRPIFRNSNDGHSEIFGDSTDGYRAMTADEIKRKLLDDFATKDEARELLKWRNATGTLLGKLAKKHPKRVKQLREGTQRQRKWEITPPHESETFGE